MLRGFPFKRIGDGFFLGNFGDLGNLLRDFRGTLRENRPFFNSLNCSKELKIGRFSMLGRRLASQCCLANGLCLLLGPMTLG